MPLLLLFACDAIATRQATPTAMLAAAPARDPKADKADKAARRAERQAAKARGNKATEKAPPARPAKPAKPAKPSAPTAGGAPLPPCPHDNALTYRSFGAGFLRTWCTGCHSSALAAADRQDAPDDVNFDRPELFKPHQRLVYERAVLEVHKSQIDPASASPMPPAGLAPAADLRRLGQWIACGSPGL
ncbi:MAG: hypothetical protein IPK80_13020 [Nannocystis sp.]|nr:hypothetical protein [Nannocystis sp.]